MTTPSSNTETVYYLNDSQLADKIKTFVDTLNDIIYDPVIDLKEFDLVSKQLRTYVLEQSYRKAERDMMFEQTELAYQRWLKARADNGA